MLPACEGFDDDHVSAAVRTWWMVIRWITGIIIVGRWRNHEQLAGEREAVLAGRASKQAVVADAVEPAWQDMEQEAADELLGGKCHHLLPVGAAAAIILVAEGDAAPV